MGGTHNQHNITTWWCKCVITACWCRLHMSEAEDNSHPISSPAGAFVMTSTLSNYRLCNLHNRYAQYYKQCEQQHGCCNHVLLCVSATIIPCPHELDHRVDLLTCKQPAQSLVMAPGGNLINTVCRPVPLEARAYIVSDRMSSTSVTQPSSRAGGTQECGLLSSTWH